MYLVVKEITVFQWTSSNSEESLLHIYKLSRSRKKQHTHYRFKVYFNPCVIYNYLMWRFALNLEQYIYLLISTGGQVYLILNLHSLNVRMVLDSKALLNKSICVCFGNQHRSGQFRFRYSTPHANLISSADQGHILDVQQVPLRSAHIEHHKQRKVTDSLTK